MFINKTDTERALYIIERILFDDPQTKYHITVNQKNSDKNIPNINLGYVKNNAMYISPGSLNESGLCCKEIKLEDLYKFNIANYKLG